VFQVQIPDGWLAGSGGLDVIQLNPIFTTSTSQTYAIFVPSLITPLDCQIVPNVHRPLVTRFQQRSPGLQMTQIPPSPVSGVDKFGSEVFV
tara:strand:- start:728 stop:1000 length:273 start_codon:yes stop_codon:yes gene_type:complete